MYLFRLIRILLAPTGGGGHVGRRNVVHHLCLPSQFILRMQILVRLLLFVRQLVPSLTENGNNLGGLASKRKATQKKRNI